MVLWFLKKLDINHPVIRPAHLCVLPTELKAASPGDIRAPAFIAALFVAAQRRPLVDEWIKRNTHLMEYYSALHRKESLTHATTWRKLENIILRD